MSRTGEYFLEMAERNNWNEADKYYEGLKMAKVTYRAIIEYDTPFGDTKDKNVVEFSIDELADEIVKAGDRWTVNHAHKCYPPFKGGKYKKVVSVTDLVRSTVELKREELI
jgi:hypothetical protein